MPAVENGASGSPISQTTQSGAAAFATTHWSVVLTAQDQSPEAHSMRYDGSTLQRFLIFPRNLARDFGQYTCKRAQLAAARPSVSAVSAVTGSTLATPRTQSVPKIFLA